MEELLALRRCKASVEYRVLKQISKGSYGDVFLAERIRDGHHVCLKQVDLDFLSPHERLGCLAEVQLLQSLPRHANVIACYDAFWDDTTDLGGSSRIMLVLEYGDGGDLDAFVQSEYAAQRAIPLEVALSVFAQIARGLGFLHDRHVLHRDIKSKNVFRFADGRVVIGDFGTCKSLAHSTALANTLVGSPLYMSPELLEDQPYSFSSDVWSLGCVLYELLVGKTPFLASSYPAVVFKITKGVYDPLPTSIPMEIHALVARMLSLDPSQRPTVHELLDDEFVNRYMVDIPELKDVASTQEAVVEVSVETATPTAQECLDDVQLMLPPPAPVVGLKPITSFETTTEPPPPPPRQPIKATQPKLRTGSTVFPTNRSRLADILSKERLNVHKTSKQQDKTKFMSCVPMLDSTIPTQRIPRAPLSLQVKKQHITATKATPSASTKPRAPVPAENMMIIGTKVHNARNNTVPAKDKQK